ncbi:MAG TPA: ATPase, T2SS/T4P/T4SS family [Acidimicrobiales bacterium]|nr:ATPase, T2SS/T4P/T4SS family [Acidimicrobiales bacterium]
MHESPPATLAVERRRLGEILVDNGSITMADLDRGLVLQQEHGGRLGEVLIEAGLVTTVNLLHAVADQVGVVFVDLDDYPVDWTATSAISVAMARRYRALPVAIEDERLVVAMANPSDVFAVDDICSVSGRKVAPVLADAAQLERAIERIGSDDGEVAAAIKLAADETGEDTRADDLAQVDAASHDAPIVRFVQLMIGKAVTDRASDIHIEPTSDGLRIRFRIDGVLHDTMHAPRTLQAGIVSRLKIMGEINIAERRVPQDGRASVRVSGRSIDMRIATIPTINGEAAVLRILDKSNVALTLEESGFLPDTLARFESAWRKPWGTVLVTGPTGSGKTSTLYATLRELNEPHRNIITVEDPVEYRLEGVKQVQVNPKAGLTFANALRSFLRADPDVLLVGEVRDAETASMVAEASLTGHLVLATLHTNDAASTPLRLLEIGLEPFLVTSSLNCVLGQRLARRVCDRCREPADHAEETLVAAGWSPDLVDTGTTPTFFRAVGCTVCSATGYRGRFAIHEVMLSTEELCRVIIGGAHSDEVEAVARAEGMRSMREDGLVKAAHGLTTLEELSRVVN